MQDRISQCYYKGACTVLLGGLNCSINCNTCDLLSKDLNLHQDSASNVSSHRTIDTIVLVYCHSETSSASICAPKSLCPYNTMSRLYAWLQELDKVATTAIFLYFH